jgi:hypothetical protein
MPSPNERSPLITPHEDTSLPDRRIERPLPRLQFAIIVMLLFSEPMAFRLVLPFIAQVQPTLLSVI